MRRYLFVRIINIVEEHDDYFVQKRNVVGAATFKIRTKKKTIRHYCPRNLCEQEQIYKEAASWTWRFCYPCLHNDRESTLANTNGTMNGDGEGDLVADLRGGGGGSTILTTRTKKVYR
jgi:hypothetical protein